MSKHNLMDIADILRGGDGFVKYAKVPGLYKAGQVAVVAHLPVSAGEMIDFQEDVAKAEKAEKEGDNPRHVERMVRMLSRHLCKEDGTLSTNEEELRAAPASALVKIMKAITSAEEDDQGNASSEPEATGSGSPTALLVT